MDKPRPTIVSLPDGPYRVEHLDRLRNAAGDLPAAPRMALCRCGGSSKKPFCDGTHARIDFRDAKLAGGAEDRVDVYEGPGISVRDNRSLCAHAGRCTDGLAKVFRYGKEPWIDAAGAARDRIVAIVHGCPSGALACAVDGVPAADPDRAPEIFVSPNGPYVVTGGPELPGVAFGKGASREHFTLCRCGGSKNKPFCDGSHHSIGFSADR
jgi:CDGSH-type Zn-finger protein